MGLHASIKRRLGIAENLKLPVLYLDNLAIHFRMPVINDARIAARHAQQMAVSLPEVTAAAVELGVLACIEFVEEVNAEGEPVGPKVRIWDEEGALTEAQAAFFAEDIAAYRATGVVSEQLHWQGVTNLHALLLNASANDLDEIVEFFTTRIKPLGDSTDLAVWTCENPECLEPDMTRPPREAGYRCTGCGKPTSMFRVIRHGAASPFRSA